MVVKHGSLVNAAERLCISQPAVSKGINQLQADHGVDLLEKHGKKLIPTDTGNGTYDIAAQIFGLEKKAPGIMMTRTDKSDSPRSSESEYPFWRIPSNPSTFAGI